MTQPTTHPKLISDPLAATVAASCHDVLTERQPALLALVRIFIEHGLTPDEVRVRIFRAGGDAYLANVCEMAGEHLLVQELC